MPTEYMTPEERAKALEIDLRCHISYGDYIAEDDAEMVRATLAAAIRAAENDMAERAAKAARDQKTFDWKGGDEWAAGYVDGKNAAAQAIEDLKHKDPA